MLYTFDQIPMSRAHMNDVGGSLKGHPWATFDGMTLVCLVIIVAHFSLCKKVLRAEHSGGTPQGRIPCVEGLCGGN